MKKTKSLQIRITEELKRDLKKQAELLNINISSLVTIAIIEKLNRIQGE